MAGGDPHPPDAPGDADPHAVAAGDLPRLSLPYADGLITIARVRRTPDAPVCRVSPGDPAHGQRATLVDFVAADAAQAARTAVALVRLAELTAVAVHARYAPSDTAALAVCLAGRLHDVRARRGLAGHVVVADHRPELPAMGAPAEGMGGVDAADLVCVPHLLAVHRRAGEGVRGPWGGPMGPAGVTDRAVWEIMSPDQHRAWLGGRPGPPVDVLEEHLGGLLTLAGLVRSGCAQIPSHAEVLGVLRGGPLTTEAVYRHPGLLLAVAAALGNREE
ncbi:hypothetical protein CC117_18160 [Parafrankia colletiae]|uniref:Uncharacterized protein n=1 Tax=Parafrankia colletiae TaxID=573497 RepID=A0A1S1QTD5_9ACTN|nr:hypothetical protein [Parafrankia colletiae]MCK9901394.1 hypothetical protein [Frankia sp. Cpl3]OHV36312.1 hypothetical protein CC117_18160 [Parafrankia colletiae]